MLRFILYLLEEFIRFKHFNTSHVTVYLAGKQNNNGVFMNFNTSHVTVYRIMLPSCLANDKISIHPMLRFITSMLF